MGLFSALGGIAGNFFAPGIGGAIGGGLGSLLDGGMGGGGGGGSNPSQSTVSQYLIPEDLKPDYESLLTKARGLYNKPFTPYTGNRIADFNPDQLSAMQGIRGMQGRYQPLLDTSSQLALQAGQQFQNGITQSDIDKFMNPYTQNVIDIQKREQLRDFDKNLAATRGRYAEAGAFGGSRGALAEAELQRNTAQQLDDMQFKGLQAGYDNSLDAAFRNRAGMMESSNQMAGLAGMAQKYNLGDYAALGAVGDQRMSNDQAQEDFNYQEFDRGLQYPKEQLNSFNQFLQGWMPEQGNMSSDPGSPSNAAMMGGLGSILGSGVLGGGGGNGNPGGSMWQQTVGGIFGGAGNRFTENGGGGAFGGGWGNYGNLGTINWKKDGGLIRKYADGGKVKHWGEDGLIPAFTANNPSPMVRTVQAPFQAAGNGIAYLSDLVKQGSGEAAGLLKRAFMDAPYEIGEWLKSKTEPMTDLEYQVYQETVAELEAAKGLAEAGNGAKANRADTNAALAANQGGIQGLAPTTAMAQGEVPATSTNSALEAPDFSNPAGPTPFVEQSGGIGSQVFRTPSFVPPQKRGNEVNMPLLKMGVALMTTPGNFRNGVGQGIKAYAEGLESEQKLQVEEETRRLENERKAQLDAMAREELENTKRNTDSLISDRAEDTAIKKAAKDAKPQSKKTEFLADLMKERIKASMGEPITPEEQAQDEAVADRIFGADSSSYGSIKDIVDDVKSGKISKAEGKKLIQNFSK